jgi:hypothetical protein
MAALEFKATVLSDGRIALPPEIAARIPAGEEISVILAWEPRVQPDSLHALGRKLVDESYASENSVYDSLA